MAKEFNDGIDTATKIIDRLNRPSQMRLQFGEMSVGEVRLLTSVLNSIVNQIRGAKKGRCSLGSDSD